MRGNARSRVTVWQQPLSSFIIIISEKQNQVFMGPISRANISTRVNFEYRHSTHLIRFSADCSGVIIFHLSFQPLHMVFFFVLRLVHNNCWYKFLFSFGSGSFMYWQKSISIPNSMATLKYHIKWWNKSYVIGRQKLNRLSHCVCSHQCESKDKNWISHLNFCIEVSLIAKKNLSLIETLELFISITFVW